MPGTSFSDILAKLPPEWSDDPTPGIRDFLQSSPAKLVIVDDDPTGSQAVYGIPLLTHWNVECLVRELASDVPAFFILTNSRALNQDQAAAANQEIGHNLREAALRSGKKIAVISRGDSTLRGHFPAEPEALARGLQTAFDAWLLVPTLPSEGRVTIGGVHYVATEDELTPVGETAYARDATFGFHSSSLPDWVEEKTSGQIPASRVQVISLDDIRLGGPERVTRRLLDLPQASVCAVDGVTPRDLEVFAAGALAAEARGRQYLYRSGPGLIPIRLGLKPFHVLSADMLPLSSGCAGGLIVVGSYVPNTSRQVAVLQERGLARGIQVDVARLLEPAEKEVEIARAARLADDLLAAGDDVLLFTSRELITGGTPEASLRIGQAVSNSLIEIIERVSVCPRYILAKGGITSNDVATKGLGVRRAMVLGQITEGVSVWQLGQESRFEGLVYIVFPGNIGQPETLAEVVQKLKRDGGSFAPTGRED